MDITGGYIGLGLLIVIVWYLAIFGEVEKEEPLVTHSIRKSSKHKKN